MRALIDTNILIRALIKPKGTVGPIIRRLRDGEFTAIYSESLLEELLEKLALPRIREKYSLTDEDVSDFLALMALRGEMVEPKRKVEVCRDPDDNKVIEAALEGQARYVITGDDDLLSLEAFETILFVTPRVFLEKL